MKLRPLNHFLINKEIKKEEKIGSIIVPSFADLNKVTKSEILFKSEFCQQVEVGEKVISRPGSGFEFEINGNSYLVLRENTEAIAVIEEN